MNQVEKFVSRGGIRVYGMPVETFPGHVNNIYLIVDGEHAELGRLGQSRVDVRFALYYIDTDGGTLARRLHHDLRHAQYRSRAS